MGELTREGRNIQLSKQVRTPDRVSTLGGLHFLAHPPEAQGALGVFF